MTKIELATGCAELAVLAAGKALGAYFRRDLDMVIADGVANMSESQLVIQRLMHMSQAKRKARWEYNQA